MPRPTFRLPGPTGIHNLSHLTHFVSARVPGPTGIHSLDHKRPINPPSPGLENPKPAAFPFIDRQEFTQTATERMGDPTLIHQRGSPLCAPSSLMFLTATNWPARYFAFASKLYQDGEATLGSLHIKPGKDCKNFRLNGRIAAADWVTIASIRDSENSFWDVDDISGNWFGGLLDGAAGMTLPSTLAGWLEQVGFTDIRNETNLYFTKGLGNFREAADLQAAGHNVCLLVNANNFNATDIPDARKVIVDREMRVESRNSFVQPFTFPNHWIVLLSPVNFAAKGGGLAFDIFSWGGRWHMKDWRGSVLKNDDWLQNYYGYVAGKPGR